MIITVSKLKFGIQGYTTWSKAVKMGSCSYFEKCMKNTLCVYDKYIGIKH